MSDDLERPILMQWFEDEEAFRPVNKYWMRQAKRIVKDREKLELTPTFPRNMGAHRAYFAQLHEVWMNIPEKLAADFPTSEHLRKRLLIQCGYCQIVDHACDSHAEAVRTSIILNEIDSYVVCKVEDDVLRVFTAESQSVRAMKAVRFRESMDAVLAAAAALIGLTPEELKDNTSIAQEEKRHGWD